jgi:hypothetical protein
MMSDNTDVPASTRLYRKAASLRAKGDFRAADDLAGSAARAFWRECLEDYENNQARANAVPPSLEQEPERGR